MLTKKFVSCVHVRFYFFTTAHFHLAASISHFLTAAMKFSCFSSNEIRLLISFCVIHVSLNIKNNVEKDTTMLFFPSPLIVRAAVRFSSVAFGLPYLLIESFILVCLCCGRSVAVAVYGQVITKFYWMVDLLSHGAPHAITAFL